MKQIPLSQARFALVDDEDYDRLMAVGKWYYANGYAVKAVYFTKDDGTRTSRNIWMHRVIMNTPYGMETDHINGDGLDNQRSNLRVCTRLENSRNRAAWKKTASGYKGVHLNKGGKFVAVIGINRRRKHLGSFDTAIEASEAYKQAAQKEFGDFYCFQDEQI